jgi:hypothetical protein
MRLLPFFVAGAAAACSPAPTPSTHANAAPTATSAPYVPGAPLCQPATTAPSDEADPEVASIPAEVRAVYDRMVEALCADDHEGVKRLALPGAVTFVAAPRKEAAAYYGPAFNLPFVRDHFDPRLVRASPVGSCCWRLNTNTSHFYFVQLADVGWRLYHAGDKPIQ